VKKVYGKTIVAYAAEMKPRVRPNARREDGRVEHTIDIILSRNLVPKKTCRG